MTTPPVNAASAISALDPSSVQVDGRNHRDRLAFSAEFSRLVLYYNQRNEQDGDWQDLFLKDPFILLAAISKTDYTAYHEQFQQLCRFRKQQEAAQADDRLPAFERIIAFQMSCLLRAMFGKLNQWLRGMRQSGQAMALQDFLRKKVKENLSRQMWIMVTVEQYLRLAESNDDISTEQWVSQLESDWKSWQGDLTRLLKTGEDGATSIGNGAIIDLLNGVYIQAVDVFVQTIDSASQNFAALQEDGNDFPDTALLVAFSKLMEIQRQRMNGLSAAHLNFYYDKILQQQPRSAQADEVVVCLTLDEKTAGLSLPQASGFLAGQYADQSDVIFESVRCADIGQTRISALRNIRYLPGTMGSGGLYAGQVATPDQLNRNQSGEVQDWLPFGEAAGTSLRQGFAIASPLLALQGGVRTIYCELTLQDTAGQSLQADAVLAGCTCYLSTASAWLDVTSMLSWTKGESGGACMVLTLTEDIAPIAALTANPDGYQSGWPLLKIVLADSACFAAPPRLMRCGLQVTVTQLKQAALANDASPLPDKGPVALFGVTPDTGSRFYLGSAEVLSKPLKQLKLTFHWEALPPYFARYYAAYNRYLAEQAGVQPGKAEDHFRNTAFSGQWKALYQGKWTVLPAQLMLPAAASPEQGEASAGAAAGDATPKSEAGSAPVHAPTSTSSKTPTITPDNSPESAPVNAAASETNTAKGSATASTAATSATSTNATSTSGSVPETSQTAPVVRLFQQGQCPRPDLTALQPNLPDSVFELDASQAPAAQPALQLQGLPVISAAESGYFCLELSGPQYGFGLSLYPKVVAAVSLQNAQLLIKQAKADILSALLAAAKKLLAAIVGLIGKMFSTVWFLLKRFFVGWCKFVVALANWLAWMFGFPPMQHDCDRQPDPPSACEASALDTTPALPDGQLLDMPELAFVPKLAGFSIAYQAGTTLDFSAGKAAAAESPYPLALYHYGAFRNYLVYDTENGSPVMDWNLLPAVTPSEAVALPGLPLISAVNGQAGMLLRLSGVSLPAQLNLYAEVSSADLLRSETDKAITWFCWNGSGWQSLVCTLDETEGLSCSGIVQLNLPALPALARGCPLMPDDEFWLVASAGAGRANIRLSYLNTQALRLRRRDVSQSPKGTTPVLAAGSVTAPLAKLPGISVIAQPFPSAGGIAAENRDSYTDYSSFYRRVSERLRHKDRARSEDDYIALAHQACEPLYYARLLQRTGGQINVGVVRRYHDAQEVNAFRPLLSVSEQVSIRQSLQARVSAMVNIGVFNLRHQPVCVAATVWATTGTNVQALTDALNQQLRLYLSPWIKSSQPQTTVGESLCRADLVSFILQTAGVAAVTSLDILLMQDDKQSVAPDPVQADDDAILVSVLNHRITVMLPGMQATEPPLLNQVLYV